MAFSRGHIRTQPQIPTSSMADIAFLLLVFFLVTTVFDEERGLPIVLPDATTIDVPQKNLLHLLVQQDGTVDVMRGGSPQITRIAAHQVAALWRSAALANPNLIAAVKTHPAASYHAMVEVLDGLQGAGAERISLQVLEDG